MQQGGRLEPEPGRRCFQGNGLVTDRMQETQRTGVQGNRTLALPRSWTKRLIRAVRLVSQDRMAPRRELCPNLVHAARERPDLQPAQPIDFAEQAIVELRMSGTGSAQRNN